MQPAMSEKRQPGRKLLPGVVLMLLCSLAMWRVTARADGSDTAAGSGWWIERTLISDQSAVYGDYIAQLRADSSGRLVLAYNHGVNKLEGVTIFNPYYAESLDGGKNWSAGAPIHEQGLESLQEVRIAMDNDDVAQAVWHSTTAIWHARESQWPDEANLVAAVGGGERVSNPDIAVGPDGALHVVWRRGNGQLYHAYSSDDGASWIPSLALSNNALSPALAVDDSGAVHVVWEERRWTGLAFHFDIHAISGSLTETGMDWPAQATALYQQTADQGEGRAPVIVAEGNRLHVALARRDSDTAQYAYYLSYQPGQGWSAPQRISGAAPLVMNTNVPFVLAPQLALCYGRLHVAYHGAYATNEQEVILGQSRASHWSGRKQATFGDLRAIRPSLACTNGQLNLAYEDVLSANLDHDIYFQPASASLSLPVVLR
jgi:hypothetical protein